MVQCPAVLVLCTGLATIGARGCGGCLPVLAIAAWAAALFWNRSHPLVRPLVLVCVVNLAGCLAGDLPLTACVLTGAPLTTLCLLPIGPALLRAGMWVSGVLAGHALIAFVFFRECGGGHRIRPEIYDPVLRALVWPYYNGHYPRGAHAVGLMLNDNVLGAWCAAWLPLVLIWRWRISTLLLLLCVAWSYSRAAALAFIGSCLYLAAGWKPAVLLALSPLPLLYALYATWIDKLRLLRPWDSAVREDRLYALTRAADQFSVLGMGPGRAGLVDSQWLKLSLELGTLGLLAYAWLFVEVFRHGKGTPLGTGCRAAVLALLLGSLGSDLFCSPALAPLLFLFCAGAQGR